MECKYTYYEIIELYPSELNSRIPLIQILRLFIYFPLLFLENIIALLTRKHSLRQYFTKEENVLGREINHDMSINIEDISKIKSEMVKNTKSKYLSKKESFNKIKNLINEGYDIDIDSLNFPFWLKERTEIIKNCKDKNKIFIVKNYPKFIKQIKKILKDF